MTEDWICERLYHMDLEPTPVAFMVRWSRPVPDPLGDWSCTYLIEWPNAPHKLRKAFGVDAVQALYIAMQNVGSELYTVKPAVFWWERDDILGLPVVSAIVDREAARTRGRL